MKRKLKFILPVLILLIAGGAYYKMSHKAQAPKLKVTGTIYVLPQDFLINLSDGQFAKLAVALVLAPGTERRRERGERDRRRPARATARRSGRLPEEAVVRAIVTNS
jgi:hypothetical protein